MKSKKTIYISIPIKGCETWSLDEAKKAQKYYEELGFEVYNPHKLACQLQKVLGFNPTEFQLLTYLLASLSKADILVLFPEYSNSFKCNAEILLASTFNIPIVRVYSMEILPFKTAYSKSINSLLNSAHISQNTKFNES